MGEAYGRFVEMHRRTQPLLLPNAWDVASGALLARLGFQAVGTTSLGVAAAAGKSDATSATLEETLALSARLSRLGGLVSVDLEGGFSDDPEEVARLVREIASTGAVGVNIEDGVATELGPLELLREKVAATKAACPDIYVNARTDTYWLGRGREGADDLLRETVRRVSAYAAAGADGVFVPALSDPAEIASVSKAVPVPLNVLFLPEGHTVSELAAAGAARISTGSLLFRLSLAAVGEAAAAIRLGSRLAGRSLPSYDDVQEQAAIGSIGQLHP